MGGAVALLLHRKDPAFWDGAVLVAPMCKVSGSSSESSASSARSVACLCLPELKTLVRPVALPVNATKFVCFQISEKVKPHPVVITLLTQVEDVIPKWKIVPTKQDVIDAAFKDPVKREKVSYLVDDCLAF